MSEDKKPREPYWAVKRYPDVERRTIQIFRNDEFVSCIESTTASDDFVNMMLRDYAELQSKYERAIKELSELYKEVVAKFYMDPNDFPLEYNHNERLKAYLKDLGEMEVSEDKEPREWMLIGNGAEPFAYSNELTFIPMANAFYSGPLLTLKERVKVIEHSAYAALKEENAKLKSLLSTLPKPRKGDWD